jgi:microcystin-dependent protein
MSEPFIGEIRMFAGNFAPVNWLLCQGQILAIADYDALFSLLGTTYGGDGQSTFALPNLQSRIPIHQAASYPLGAMGGVEAVILTPQQMPVHTHPAAALSQSGSSAAPAQNVWAAWDEQGYASAAPNATMSAASLTPAGGNQPHDNLPPYLVINFIISLFGIFPSQN